MGKGGMAALGWVLIGVGGLLLYAGMTGQSLAGELQAILSGKSPKAPAPATPGGDGQSGFAQGAGAAGSGGGGGGGGSW